MVGGQLTKKFLKLLAICKFGHSLSKWIAFNTTFLKFNLSEFQIIFSLLTADFEI